MERKRLLRNMFTLAALMLVAMLFTSCEAKFGGEITVGYFIGCVVCAVIWFIASIFAEGVKEAVTRTEDPFSYNNGANWVAFVSIVLALILVILPFLWHPIPKFNLILLIVNLVQIVLFSILSGKIHNDGIKLPESKKTREREAREAAERKAREEQEAKEKAEREAKEAAERKAREEQEAKERAARRQAAADKLSSLFPAFLSSEMVRLEADDDAPVNPFFMAKTSVTEELWGLIYPDTVPANPRRPVTGVSFFKAIEFCNRMSKAAGLRPCYVINGSTDPDKWPAADKDAATWDGAECVFEADGFRLPEESEFLYACAGGAANEQTLYPGSGNLGEVAWCEFNSDGTPHDVATKKPNSLGLYDLNGNVQQWTWDRGDGDSPATPERLAYGGSFKLATWQNFGRVSLPATCTADDMGLRLVRSITG